jgi:MHS family proline/betaine transporter-like MFS transporter
MSELLPTRIRSTGIAVAYNIPVAVFGGSAPLISTWLIQQTGDISSPWYFYIGTGVVSLIALTILRKEDFVACTSAMPKATLTPLNRDIRARAVVARATANG